MAIFVLYSILCTCDDSFILSFVHILHFNENYRVFKGCDFCFSDSPQAMIDVGAQIFFYEANRREKQSFSLTSFSTNDAAFFRPIKRRSGTETEKCSRFCFFISEGTREP